MTMQKDKFIPPHDEMWFLPLGGSGEIGTNLNLYGHNGTWIMVDFGISFGNEHTPGVEVFMPDIAFLEERLDRLEALILTHAHEDHLGAIPYIWKRLNCPIYCTQFTGEIVKNKLDDKGIKYAGKLKIIKDDELVQFKNFQIQMVPITHSIPEPCAMFIKTPVGRIFHTGDWRIEHDPVIGKKTDVELFKRIGEEGVDVLVCDSTNADVQKIDGTEKEVEANLAKIFSEYHSRILITCFASNVGRVVSIMRAATRAKKKVSLVGRSMWRMFEAAKVCGYIENLPDLIPVEDIEKHDPNEMVLICTGSQGEQNAALARIAKGSHHQIRIRPKDMVMFSSREIPGNELSLNIVKNQLSHQGVKLLTPDEAMIHVSGHPAQDQLRQMYGWLKPKTAIPVHGELMHQQAHSDLAYECGVEQVKVPINGEIIVYKAGKIERRDIVKSGKLAVQGDKIVHFDPRVISDRFKFMFSGMVTISIAIDDEAELAGDPVVTSMGIFNAEDYDIIAIDEEIFGVLSNLKDNQRGDDKLIADAITPRIRKYLSVRYGIKPNVQVHIIRV